LIAVSFVDQRDWLNPRSHGGPVKLFGVLLILAAATPRPEIRYFRYQRPLQNVPQGENPTCTAVDATLFAHAESGLADVRLYRGRTETPYLLQTPAPVANSFEQVIEPLNPGVRGGQTVFDAAMRGAGYSDIQLKVTGQDFIATVNVSGSQQQTGPETKIGNYTIFDLTRQKLGRSTVLHLPRLDFRYLHFRIAGPLGPEDIGGLSIEKLPAEQPAYTTVAETTRVSQKDRASLIEFTVPAHVPVERIAFVPGASPANFSRDVTVEVRPAGSANDSAEPPPPVTSTGNILRVHMVQDDRRIDQENLAIDAPRADFDSTSTWTITIDNGDNALLAPASVRLQMLRRDLCFEATGGDFTLYYGDPKLSSPRYDLGQYFVVKDAVQATAGPEQPNSEYQPRPDDRPFTEKHPLLLWIMLALVIVVLGGIALRSAKLPKT
jgi:uncharacterized protein DUF3999